MSSILPAVDWEAMFAPYDRADYRAVLELLQPGDVVLDIGAGDLRLSRQMAAAARKVYAVERSFAVLRRGLGGADPLPANLIPICADARTFEFPPGISVGVLMMRHCTHFRLYAEKLHAAGAKRIITNARWRMGVEAASLGARRIPFRQAGMGWYACLCGAAGFKEGPAEQWSGELDGVVSEVTDCPECRSH